MSLILFNRHILHIVGSNNVFFSLFVFIFLVVSLLISSSKFIIWLIRLQFPFISLTWVHLQHCFLSNLILLFLSAIWFLWAILPNDSCSCTPVQLQLHTRSYHYIQMVMMMTMMWGFLVNLGHGLCHASYVCKMLGIHYVFAIPSPYSCVYLCVCSHRIADFAPHTDAAALWFEDGACMPAACSADGEGEEEGER